MGKKCTRINFQTTAHVILQKMKIKGKEGWMEGRKREGKEGGISEGETKKAGRKGGREERRKEGRQGGEEREGGRKVLH